MSRTIPRPVPGQRVDARTWALMTEAVNCLLNLAVGPGVTKLEGAGGRCIVAMRRKPTVGGPTVTATGSIWLRNRAWSLLTLRLGGSEG
jgi:hypothetical protein